MANPLKGEVSFDADGKNHTIRFTTNSICTLEAELGLSIDEISNRLVRGYLSVLRSALRVALPGNLRHEDVGNLIDEIGPRAAVEHLLEALKLAFPVPDEGENPQMGAAAGTGETS